MDNTVTATWGAQIVDPDGELAEQSLEELGLCVSRAAGQSGLQSSRDSEGLMTGCVPPGSPAYS